MRDRQRIQVFGPICAGGEVCCETSVLDETLPLMAARRFASSLMSMRDNRCVAIKVHFDERALS